MAYVNGQWVPDATAADGEYNAEARQQRDATGSHVNLASAAPPAPSAPQPFTFPSDFSDIPDAIKQQTVGQRDLNPLAAQSGLARDRLATYRDSVGQQTEDEIRRRATAQGLRLDQSGAAVSDLYTANGNNIDATLAAITAAQRGTGASGSASRDGYNITSPGFQFSDPYTRQLEDVIHQQMTNLSQPQQNPALEQLLGFLGQRFNTLTQSPGYSPEELAILRTQALEPIEQDRQASRARALQHAATAGYLPTSGITNLAASPTGGVEPIDVNYDRLRAAAQRDLAINAIGKRTQDLNSAVSLGQLAGVAIPQTQRAEDQQRRSELLNLASSLYQLPRTAQQDAMAVINGTEGTSTLFNQALQSQQAQLQQQQADAQRWTAIIKAAMDMWDN